MDNQKIGAVIRQLRKEKGMTQSELASAIQVDPRTVSKWECGRGLPDVGLLRQLSDILQTDIGRLLGAETQPNRPDAGKLSRAKFYVCPVCGNILFSTGKATLFCCGYSLQPLEVQNADEVHEPTVEQSDGDYYVTFAHEMSKAHHIVFAAAVVDDRITLIRMYPEQEAAFRLPMYRRGMKLYVYCTEHGLMRCSSKL